MPTRFGSRVAQWRTSATPETTSRMLATTVHMRRAGACAPAEIRVDHGRVGGDRGRGALEGDAPALEDIGAVGQRQGLEGHLLDEQDGHALLPQAADGGEDFTNEHGGQTQRRLVEEHDAWPRHEPARHRQHLLLAAGEGRGREIKLPGQGGKERERGVQIGADRRRVASARARQRAKQEIVPHALVAEDAALKDWADRIVRFITAPDQNLDLPLDIQGTAFQARVWRALQKIPLGETASYTDIAATLGQPKAVRAVAQACAANKLALLVPCHRVIRSNGDLGGYRWGLERKRALLAAERAAAAREPADEAAA